MAQVTKVMVDDWLKLTDPNQDAPQHIPSTTWEEHQLLRAWGQREEARDLARQIHQALKRGDATEDHGLIGNLKCILEHVTPDPPPFC